MSTSKILDLPVELVDSIASHLPPLDVLSLRLVSRAIATAVQHHFLKKISSHRVIFLHPLSLDALANLANQLHLAAEIKRLEVFLVDFQARRHVVHESHIARIAYQDGSRRLIWILNKLPNLRSVVITADTPSAAEKANPYTRLPYGERLWFRHTGTWLVPMIERSIGTPYFNTASYAVLNAVRRSGVLIEECTISCLSIPPQQLFTFLAGPIYTSIKRLTLNLSVDHFLDNNFRTRPGSHYVKLLQSMLNITELTLQKDAGGWANMTAELQTIIARKLFPNLRVLRLRSPPHDPGPLLAALLVWEKTLRRIELPLHWIAGIKHAPIVNVIARYDLPRTIWNFRCQGGIGVLSYDCKRGLLPTPATPDLQTELQGLKEVAKKRVAMYTQRYMGWQQLRTQWLLTELPHCKEHLYTEIWKLKQSLGNLDKRLGGLVAAPRAGQA